MGKQQITDGQLYDIANLGHYFIEACNDCDVYLPPDESEVWINTDRLLYERDKTESALRKALEDLING